VQAKRIRDPIHGYIPVDGPVLAVLDTPEVQRLRRVHQLGTANLVYPGANHTRFEHALGACHLGGLASEALDLPRDEALDLRLGLLLHDVGHGPFSHLSEPAMERTLGVGHKDLGIRLVEGPLRDTIEAVGGDVARIARLISGLGELGALVSGDLDLDRMDYLVRDAHYTGVNVDVDLARLLAGLTRRGGVVPLRADQRHKGTLALQEEALGAAEMLLVARFQMYANVYYHHAARVADRMLARAIDLALEAGELTPEVLFRMDDGDLLARLRTSGTPAAELASRLDRRALWKCAREMDARQAGILAERLRGADARADAERVLAQACGLQPWQVVVDLPEVPLLPEVRAPVLGRDGQLRPLHERSALVASLRDAQRDHWRLRVIGPAEAREALDRAAGKALGA